MTTRRDVLQIGACVATSATVPAALAGNARRKTITSDTYGPMKALCEQYSMQAFKGHLSIVRPGYIVGPLDPSDRFTYWPVRASKGGEMLAPGTPHDPIQIIDVRDLAAWMMKLVESRTKGYFNAVSTPGAFAIGGLISSSQNATPQAGTTVTWVPEDFLAAHWKADELDLPPWSPMSGDMAGASLTAAKLGARPAFDAGPCRTPCGIRSRGFNCCPPSGRQSYAPASIRRKRPTRCTAGI